MPRILGSLSIFAIIPYSIAVAPAHSEVIQVQAASPWQDTGIDILAGSRLNITASGLVCYGGCANLVDPNGVSTNGLRDGTMMIPGTVLPDAIALSLIGKIGGTTAIGTGTPLPQFAPGKGAGFVGSQYSQTILDSGRLFLGFNDDQFLDNSRAFTVTVVPEPSAAILGFIAVAVMAIRRRVHLPDCRPRQAQSA